MALMCVLVAEVVFRRFSVSLDIIVTDMLHSYRASVNRGVGIIQVNSLTRWQRSTGHLAMQAILASGCSSVGVCDDANKLTAQT